MKLSFYKNLFVSLLFFCISNTCTAQNTITVNGESFVSLESKNSIIKFIIEVNSPNLANIDSFVEKEIQKLPKDKIETISLIKKELLNTNPASKELSKNAALKSAYHYTLVVESKNIMPLTDFLFSQTAFKVIGIQSLPNTSSDALKKAYAQSIENAKIKAAEIAKSANANLGNILEIISGEEPIPANIREQLMEDPQSINHGSNDIRIFSTLKFELHPKIDENSNKK